jgi:NADH dehydrogenase/NADH:ubiquinone oxidoreductase subunit G
MPKKIKITLDGREIICDEGATIMRVARNNGIHLPSLCFHPDFSVKANCRICVVEISPSAGSGQEAKLVTSCSTKVEDGMDIKTDTPRVKRSRNLNIELIFAEHIEKCPTCIWRVNCKLLDLAERYKIEITRFKDRKAKRKIYKFANAVEIDGSQCIDCRNCLEACNNLQKINFLELRGKGIEQEVVPVTERGIFSFRDKNRKKTDCIYCGQCAVHCPVGAAQEHADWELVEKALKDKTKVVVAQFAPSIRVSIGEEFGLESGKIMTGQVVAALKKLGFNYVFDVNFGADVTTIVEAEELLERVKSGQNLPMFTACCPAWIKYVEFFRPDLIPNMTTARSPQMHSAGIIKTYWADKMNINPKNIVVVSVMPCTAKKFEAGRKEMKLRGGLPIDHVITTR